MADRPPCPVCQAPSLRPDVVWFGEMPMHMEVIQSHLNEAGLFAAIGTSGEVYPAAGFVMEALRAGADTVEINLEPSGSAGVFNRRLIGPASEVVPRWVDELLSP